MSSPAPVWLDDIVREFGRSAGLSDFALNDRGAAAISFETGAQLRFEYAFESLVVALSVPYRFWRYYDGMLYIIGLLATAGKIEF